MKLVKMTRSNISQYVGEDDIDMIEQLEAMEYKPARDANGKIIVIDSSELVRRKVMNTNVYAPGSAAAEIAANKKAREEKEKNAAITAAKQQLKNEELKKNGEQAILTSGIPTNSTPVAPPSSLPFLK